jgi:hypothetical protein
MNINQASIADNTAAMGGIGAGAAIAVAIAAAVAYSMFAKKAPPKKGKKRGEQFSELDQLKPQQSPLYNKINSTRVPAQVQRVNVTSLPRGFNANGERIAISSIAATKVSFNPVTAAAAKAIGVTPHAKPIQNATPLDMYRAHNMNLDRMSIKRPVTNVKMAAVNEARTTFQPVRKEWKPQAAKTSLVPKARTPQLSTLNAVAK